MQLSEKIFTRFFENSLEIFCVFDSKWKFLKLNKIWEKAFDYTSTELEGKYFLDVVHPDDISDTIKFANSLKSNIEEKKLKNRIITSNNSYKWLEWSFFFDGDFIYASARDIKQEQQTENNFLIYQTICDTVTIGLIYSKNSKIVWANETFLKLFNYKLDDIKGQNLFIFHRNEDEFNKNKKDAHTSFKKGEPYYLEVEVTNNNGYKQWIATTGKVLYPGNPEEGIVWIVKEITKEKQKEKEIKQLDDLQKTILDTLTVGISFVKDRKIIWCNKAHDRIFSYARGEMVGLSTLKTYMKEEEFKRVKKEGYAILEKGLVYDTVIEGKTKNGEKIWINLTGKAIDKDKPEKGSIWILKDITVEKQSKEMLKIFKLSVELASDEVYWIKKDAGFEYVNQKACKSLGYSQEELLSLSVFDIDPIFTKEMWNKLWIEISAMKEGTIGNQFETLHKRKDGSIFPVEIVMSRLIIEEKIIYVAYARDISERKKNEENLKRFKISIDYSLDEVYWLNKDASFEYVNKQASNSLGYTNDEFNDINLFDIDPNYTKERWDKLWDSYQGHKKYGGIGKRKESIHKRKDGTTYPVEITVNHIWLNDNELHISYVRDISERKKNEEILLKNQKMLSETQRIANVGSWELDLKTKQVTWSKQTYEIFGLKDYNKPITLEYFFQFVHTDDKDYVEQVITESLETKLFRNFECRVIRSDNKTVTLLGEGELLLNEDGIPTHVLGAVQDITEQKKAEAKIKKLNSELEVRVLERTSQLDKVNKELEAFAYSVSHDLRAPIRHIDGFLSLMYSNISNPNEYVKTYYQKISSASKRMSVMIDGLLKFSRLGRASINFVPVDISELINEIIEQLKPDYSQRKINWEIKKMPVVNGDSTLLRLAFENLISNAIKYSAEKDQAEIEIGVCNEQKNNVCIYIKDNGVGFDMTYKDKLFGVFQRLHSNSEFEGIGIGLANTKQIILKHNGKIDAVSEVNRGAIFYVTLPIII